jgi:hypothetical protein
LFNSAFIDCLGGLRAVAFIEITLSRLKARKQAISHHSSKRRFATARVERRAVDFIEINFID